MSKSDFVSRPKPMHFIIASLVALVLSTFAAVAAPAVSSAAQSGDTVTFTPSSLDSNSLSPVFAEQGSWQISWTYDCSQFGMAGNFIADVFAPDANGNSTPIAIGPNEIGNQGSGEDYYFAPGSFKLGVISECTWSVTVSPYSGAPGPATETFSSSQYTDSGSTSSFTETGPWSMQWSYSCPSGVPQDIFIGSIVRSGDISPYYPGPSDPNASGSGTENYQDAGQFNVEIDSDCTWSVTVSPIPPATPTPTPQASSAGYWMLDAAGNVYPFGSAPNLGSATSLGSASAMAATPDGKGYWVTSPGGSVKAFGDAPQLSVSATPSSPVVSIVSTHSGNGFWMVTNLGQVITAGDAQNFGSPQASGIALAKGIVNMVATPDGGGYWLLGGDGGVFSYGDAKFFGSTGAIHLAAPATAMFPTATGNGYWFVATDGGIFAYGDAQYYGSSGDVNPLLPAGGSNSFIPAKPINGMVASADGKGYWMVASDGGVFAFGDAGFVGSLGASPPANPIVGFSPA